MLWSWASGCLVGDSSLMLQMPISRMLHSDKALRSAPVVDA